MQISDSELSRDYELSITNPCDTDDDSFTSTVPPGQFVTLLEPSAKKRWKAAKIEAKAVAKIFGGLTACVSAFAGERVVVVGAEYTARAGNPFVCDPFQRLREQLAVVAQQFGPKKCNTVSSATRVCGKIITDWIRDGYDEMLSANTRWKCVIGDRRRKLLPNFFRNNLRSKSRDKKPSKTLKISKEWKCGECTAEFTYLKSLKGHYREKHPSAVLNYRVSSQIGITNHYCSECDRYFKSAQSLGGHRSNVHTSKGMIVDDPRPFQCNQCSANFKKQSKLDRHFASCHSKSRPFKCTEEGCGKSYKRKDRLDRHLMRHQTVKRFKCSHSGCDLQFNRKDRLRRHETDIHGPPQYHCEFCSEQFRKKRKLKKHMALEHNAMCPFVCKECNRRFARQCDLDRHFQRRHVVKLEQRAKVTKDGSMYICSNCNATFDDEELHRIHLHHCIGWSSRKWKCKECGKEYKDLRSLNRHHRIKHGKTTVKVNSAALTHLKVSGPKKLRCIGGKLNAVACADCGLEFKNGHALGGHRARKHPIKLPMPIDNAHKELEYECKDCGRQFKNGHALGGHRARVHTVKRVKRVKTKRKSMVIKKTKIDFYGANGGLTNSWENVHDVDLFKKETEELV